MAGGDETAPDASVRPFHEKLDHLFRTVRNPDTGKLYSLRDVSARLPANITGRDPSYLAMLRSGERGNPGLELVTSLAKIFGVPIRYFVDDVVAQRVDEQLGELYALKDLQDAMEDPDVRVIAVRARGLSSRSLGQLVELVRTFRELEGLDDKADGERSPADGERSPMRTGDDRPPTHARPTKTSGTVLFRPPPGR